jgi:hypothetical protein
MKKIAGKIISTMLAANDKSAIQEPNNHQGVENLNTENFYQRMLDRDVYLHISEISVAMVGVCLTGVSILQIDQDLDNANSYIDDVLAADSLFFMTSCLLAYWSVRVAMKGNRHVRKVASIANIIFLIGMVIMAVVCGCIVYQADMSLTPQK